jgi:hypothetical protein
MTGAQPGGTGPDLYLGPLRASRPRRVAVAGVAGDPSQAERVLDTLRSLRPVQDLRADRLPPQPGLGAGRKDAETPRRYNFS